MANEELEKQINHLGVGVAHLALLVDMNIELTIGLIDTMGVDESVEEEIMKLIKAHNEKAENLQKHFDEVREAIDNGGE